MQTTDAAHWATPVARLSAPRVPSDAVNLNLDGRRPIGVVQGFGQLWKKTYRVSLPASTVTPERLVRIWKERFERFWPTGNRFFAPFEQLNPGDVALINMRPLPGPIRLSTGIVVIYADDESFSFMTPEGHMFAGWIMFSASREADAVVAQVVALIRTSDPAWELVMRVFGAYHREDHHWAATLRHLAAYFGVTDAKIEMSAVCLDRKLQWSKAANVWRNAALWSGVYWLSTPLRLLGRLPRR